MSEQINIQKFDTESNSMYIYRLNYINCILQKNIPTTNMYDIIKNSKILANMKFKKCKYDPKIYNQLKEYL